MRKAVVAVAAAAALAATGSALAAGGSLHVQSSVTIRYGSHVVLHGAAPAGTPVTLLAARPGSATANGVAAETKLTQALQSTEASSAGAFRFEVAPERRTVYVAQGTNGIGRIVVNVMPRIGLRRNGTVRVAPVAAFAGKPVVLQQLVGGQWVSLMRAEIGGNGVAHVAHWTPGATLRAVVPAIGHGFVAGTSKILTADGGIVLR